MICITPQSIIAPRETASQLDGKSGIKRNGNRRKRVTFATYGQARATLSRKNYTESEMHFTWYSNLEYMGMRKSCMKQILKLEAGDEFKDVKYCSRGLENQTLTGYKARSNTRRDSIDAVLFQQELLRIRRSIRTDVEADDSDSSSSSQQEDEEIAQAYRHVTSSSQLWAASTGLSDARAAEDVDDVLFDDDDTEEERQTRKSWTCKKTQSSSSSSSEESNSKKDHRIAMLSPSSAKRPIPILPLHNMSYARTA